MPRALHRFGWFVVGLSGVFGTACSGSDSGSVFGRGKGHDGGPDVGTGAVNGSGGLSGSGASKSGGGAGSGNDGSGGGSGANGETGGAAGVPNGAGGGSAGADSGTNPDAGPNGTAGAGGTSGASGSANAGGKANAGGTSGGGGGPVIIPSSCHRFGDLCQTGADCCSTLCDGKSHTCAANTTTCAPSGSSCGSSTECCTLSCVGGKCGATACISDNQACTSDAACCGGTCTGGKCAPLTTACHSAGNTCASDGECCSHLCTSGHCQLGSSFCIQTNDVCSKGSDCCSATCTIPTGKTLGTCAAPPSAPTYCKDGVDGTVCGSCNDCCSRLCAPYGATGVFICQPASGCHVNGDLCKTTGDCCGAPGTGLPGDGNVVCEKEAGAAVGICRNPQSCNPQGNVCHFKDYACSVSSARNNCCDGVGNSGVCQLDALGVPRCNGLGTTCRDAGETCASADDCCDGAPCVPDSAGMLRCYDHPDGGTSCVPHGGGCTINADCCAGSACIAPVGSTQGTCSVPPPPPGTGGAGNTGGAGGTSNTGGKGGAGGTSNTGGKGGTTSTGGIGNAGTSNSGGKGGAGGNERGRRHRVGRFRRHLRLLRTDVQRRRGLLQRRSMHQRPVCLPDSVIPMKQNSTQSSRRTAALALGLGATMGLGACSSSPTMGGHTEPGEQLDGSAPAAGGSSGTTAAGGSANMPDSGLIFGNGASVGMSVPMDASCGHSTIAAAPPDVSVLLVIDESGSMTDKPAGFDVDKWTAMKSAMHDALTSANPSIAFGLELFPFPVDKAKPIPLACTDNCCEMPAVPGINVPIAAGPTAVPKILSALDGSGPAGGTPTKEALRRAHDYFTKGAGATLKGERYVLLATDGGPNCDSTLSCAASSCTTNLDGACPIPGGASCCDPKFGGAAASSRCLDDGGTEAQIKALRTAGVRTFVVGIPGSEAYGDALDAFATAGGEALATGARKYFAVAASGGVTALGSALEAITKGLITSCRLVLDSRPPDLGKLNVTVDDVLVPQAGPDGWDVDTTSSPPAIVLKGATCADVEMNGAQKVVIQYGCPTLITR